MANLQKPLNMTESKFFIMRMTDDNKSVVYEGSVEPIELTQMMLSVMKASPDFLNCCSAAMHHYYAELGQYNLGLRDN